MWKCFGGTWRNDTTQFMSELSWVVNWVVSFLQVPPKHFHTFNRCQNLIATVLHTPQTLSKISELPAKGVKINLHSSSSLIHKCQNYFSYIYHPLQVFSSSLLMKTSCLRLKLVELNFLVSFNTDDQSKTDVANAINVITYCQICSHGCTMSTIDTIRFENLNFNGWKLFWLGLDGIEGQNVGFIQIYAMVLKEIEMVLNEPYMSLFWPCCL